MTIYLCRSCFIRVKGDRCPVCEGPSYRITGDFNMVFEDIRELPEISPGLENVD